jgi:hypothetical protein
VPGTTYRTDCEIRIDYRFDLVDLGESLGPVVECVHDSMVLVNPVPRGFRNGDLFGLLRLTLLYAAHYPSAHIRVAAPRSEGDFATKLNPWHDAARSVVTPALPALKHRNKRSS